MRKRSARLPGAGSPKKRKVKPVAPPEEISPRPKSGTLGWLDKQGWTEGQEFVRRAIEQWTSRADRAAYQVLHEGEGRPIYRNDPSAHEYLDYSPPSLWGAPYSVLRVAVKGTPWEESQPFMFHGGEEILIPIEGEVSYVFAQTSAEGLEVSHPTVVRTGQIVRVNPQLPHFAWGLPNGTTTAWMFMRYLSDSARGLVGLDPSLLTASERSPAPRSITLEQLQSPTTHALVAWGLSEYIRILRQRANLTVDGLGKACGIDAGLLSRMESVQRDAATKEWDLSGTNLSLDALLKLCEFLSLPLLQLIDQASWVYDIGTMLERPTDLKKADAGALFTQTASLPHHLHTNGYFLKARPKAYVFPVEKYFDSATAASWIVLKGAVTVEMQFRQVLAPVSRHRVTLSEGSVLHLRDAQPATLEVHTDTTILQVTYLSACRCDRSAVPA